MIDIVLQNKDKVFATPALVDSGATPTFIPLWVARLMGVELDKQNHDIVGDGGNFPTYVTTIASLKVLKGKTILAEFEKLSICVPSCENGIDFVVLGRDSIFQRFLIRFEEANQQIQLQKTNM